MLFVEILACKSKISVRLFQVSLTGGNGQDLSDANWNHFTLQWTSSGKEPSSSAELLQNIKCFVLIAFTICLSIMARVHALT